VSLVEQLLMLC